MPEGVIDTVEEIQEHRTDESRSSPIPTRPAIFGVHIGPGIVLLPGVATTPNGHGAQEEADQGSFGADRAAEVFEIEERTQNHGADNLGKPVQEAVQGLGASVEVGSVNGILLVSVEPVGRPEHGEKENHVRVESESFPQADKLGFPGRVLHQDDPSSITADDLLALAKHESQDSTNAHKNDKCNIGAVRDILIFLDGDVRAEGDLEVVSHLDNTGRIPVIRTKLPKQAPTLKIPQNQAK